MMGTGSGTITVRASNACDTSIAISRTVFVHPLPNPIISQSGWSLSTGTFNSYQWLLNNNPIPGATTNPYTATNPGIYRVIVTDANGCTDTSAALSLSVHGASTSKSNIEVFPNPATTQLFIKAAEPVYVSIYTSDGRLAVENTTEKTIDISTLSPGYYQLKIADKEGTLLKLEKLAVLPH
ncbi:MAG: T9SS type A sorting domain-containing protein [Flavipsychrobacter sp.]|nr:T9SS type A sorting domain-containing protein [Flavipsychrobacter sp.]